MTESELPYAPVAKRIEAYLLDAVIAGLVLVFAGVAPVMLTHRVGMVAIGYAALAVLGLVQWGLLGTRGYTIGKAGVGLRVVDVDTGAPIGMGRALLRLLVLGVLGSCLLPLIAVVLAMRSDARRQGWHDKAARSVVLIEEDQDLRPVDAGLYDARLLAVEEPAPSHPVSAADAPTPSAYAGVPAGAVDGPLDEVTMRPADLAAARQVQAAQAAQTAPPAPPADPTTPQWVLRPRIGADFRVTGPTLLGRDPDGALYVGAALWPLDDPALTVSKTHALVTVGNDALWVEDVDSTHGVVIRRAGDEVRLDTRRTTKVFAGDVLVLGAFEVSVTTAG